MRGRAHVVPRPARSRQRVARRAAPPVADLEQAIAGLLDLDRAHGSQLFRTLETYLENRGNAGQTATALYVHRNTLRQRLRRIAGIIDVDPSDPAAWFDLVLAVRLIRFRGIGEESPERGG